MRTFVVLGAAALALGVLPGHALANGRFPEAQRLLEHPRDPNRLYLAATYGLLFSEDRGQNWYYVCETSFALAYLEGDPLLEVLPDGKLVSGIHDSLTQSTDCGCSWTATLATSDLENVLDVTLDSDGKLVALVQGVSTTPARLLYESADHGASWQKLSDLPADLPEVYTVDVAPSDSARLYVTATATARPTGVLLVSADRGANWEERAIEGTSSSIQPYIAAVSATDPDVVYVRTHHWDEMTEYAAQDSLLLTTDAGGMFREILHRQAKLLGFALSPDGTTVLAGYGDPIIAGRSTNAEDLGIYKASTSDHVFERISDEAVSCLRWTATGVYACIADLPDVPSPDLALGFAPNADFTLADADPLTVLLDNKNVKGALGCTGAICAETWSMGLEGNVSVCQALRADCEADASMNALSCPADPGGAGGAAGMAGAAGATSGGSAGSTTGGAGAGGAFPGGGAGLVGGGSDRAGTTGAGGTSPNEDGDEESGCGCRQHGAESRRSLGVALIALLVAVAAVRGRSRRRKERPS